MANLGLRAYELLPDGSIRPYSGPKSIKRGGGPLPGERHHKRQKLGLRGPLTSQERYNQSHRVVQSSGPRAFVSGSGFISRKMAYRRKRYARRTARRLTRRKTAYENGKYISPSYALRNVNVGLGLPRSVRVAMPYFTTFQIDTNDTAHNHEKVFNLMSVYEPEVGGHQPYTFDQWMAFFQKFRVYGVKFELTVQVEGDTANQGTILMVYDDKDAVDQTVLNTAAERPGTIVRTLGHGAGQRGGTHITKYFSIKKILGHTNIVNDLDLEGSASGNPSLNWYVHVKSFPIPNAAHETVRCSVKLTYYCQLNRIEELIGS